MGRFIFTLAMIGPLVLAVGGCESLAMQRNAQGATVPEIVKQPVQFVQRAFDPANPPSDMPPLAPGEAAKCDSEFISSANLAGETMPHDATHATLTITKVRMILQLRITIWGPDGASAHVIEHEMGHRQISESYYRNADKVAARVAAPYLGKQIEISGADLRAESNRQLQLLAAELTDAYNKQLDPGPVQLLYDSITDHSRNEVAVAGAVQSALTNVAMETTQASSPDKPE
jgi:hypothetical protein